MENLDALLAAQTPSLARRVLPWLFLLVVIGAGTGAASYYASIERPLAVDVIVVSAGDVERTVASVAAGRVAARHRARVASDLIGRIAAVHAKKGQHVEKGQLIVELDTRDATAQLDMVRHARDAALGQITELKSRLTWVRADHSRKVRLGPGVIAPGDLDRAQMEVSALEAQLVSLESRASEVEARIRSCESMLEKHRIRAPFAGVISELWVELGEVTTTMGIPGSKTDTSSGRLFEIIDLEDLYVTCPIDEVDLARVTTGLAARVTLDPYPKDPFLGTVTRVAPYVLDVEEQNRTVEIEVSIPATLKGRSLKPGTSADVEVIIERKESVLRIPAHLLIDGKRAMIVEGDRIVAREVETGIENWRYAEVKLPAGTLVVAGAAGDVRPKAGQLVTVRKKLDVESR